MSDTPEVTTLVSIFHTRERASEALRDLQSAGIPTTAIQSLGGETGTGATQEQSLATLKTLNLPADDMRVISDGLKGGGSLLIVRAQQAVAEKAEDVLERYHAHQIDERSIGTQALADRRPVATSAVGETMIPIVEEQLVVGKRKVQSGGVRVFSHVVETPVEEQVVLQEEHARIERHAVNRPISASEADALQSQTIEVREMAEEAVVSKTARVVEEVSVGKQVTERTEQIHDTVRKTQVEVSDIEAADNQRTEPATRR